MKKTRWTKKDGQKRTDKLFDHFNENRQMFKRTLQMKMHNTESTKQDGRVKMDKRKMDIRTLTK